MDIRELALRLKLGKTGTLYRLRKLGIAQKEVYNENDFDALQNYVSSKMPILKDNKNLLIWEFFKNMDDNSTTTIARELGLSVTSVNYRLDVMIKNKFIIVPSKINFMK